MQTLANFLNILSVMRYIFLILLFTGTTAQSQLQHAKYAVTTTASSLELTTYDSTYYLQNATTNTNQSYLVNVLDFGIKRGWATAVQNQKLIAYLAMLTQTQQTAITGLIKTAITPSAKFFALKSLLAGDVETTLKTFIAELNKYPEAEQQRRCTVFQQQGLVQKWQYSCSIAVVLNYVMELCPRYAFDVQKVIGYNKIINDPANDMAQQEKLYLEQYGGKASARGDVSGKPIGIIGPINALVGNLLGVQFYASQITGPTNDALTSIRKLLDGGMNVPVLIEFLPGRDAHFVLFFRQKFEAGQYWYMVYEPWEGKCAWISTNTILSNSLSPLLAQYQVQLTYYYPTY